MQLLGGGLAQRQPMQAPLQGCLSGSPGSVHAPLWGFSAAVKISTQASQACRAEMG